VHDRKELRQLAKRRQALDKDVQLYENAQKGDANEELKLSPEKKKELADKQKEAWKLNAELKKRTVHHTTCLGVDAEEREYLVFAGDKERLYVRTLHGGHEVWGCYSTKVQIDALMNALQEKGRREKRLKAKLSHLIPNLRLAEATVIHEE
jgi:hypothetical protein